MDGYFSQSLFSTASDTKIDEQGRVIKVAFENGADMEFSYIVPDKLWPVLPGCRVKVPFGKKNHLQDAFCIEVCGYSHDKPSSNKFKLKAICEVVDQAALLDDSLIELARWISSYYVCPLGQVLAAMVPSAVKKGAGVQSRRFAYLNNCDDLKLRSGRQTQVIEYLRHNKAIDHDSAIETTTIAKEIGCTAAVLKSLQQKIAIKIFESSVLKSLPAIPESLWTKAENVTLNEYQRKALAQIHDKMDAGNFAVTLLHGVTGSGKTEVYIKAIEHAISKGKSAIVLLPEIALTAQTVQRFKDRFERIAVMHSGLSDPQRNAQWQMIRSGQADVVIGARSAVFAPLSNLGLIVVDEEHEPSYKQDTVPRYNGRDVAIKRAHMSRAHCILGTATPSLETINNCRAKKFYQLASLPFRVMDLPMPQMRLVDMSAKNVTQNYGDLISKPLADELTNILKKGEQAILLINRRGYSNFIFCPSCRHTVQCRNCDVTLTFHKSPKKNSAVATVTGDHIADGYAVCHHCLSQMLVPKNCPICGKHLLMLGIGSQRLEEELAAKFPSARIARLDSDSMAGGDYFGLLKDFGQGKIDILAGTQMLAKGLHFPNVTVVGIISADTCLYIPDFRSNERTFQLISQVSGRTGRSSKKGIVYIQTFLPEQPAIKYALNNDLKGFVAEELKHRKLCNLPPFWKLALIMLRDPNFAKLEISAKAVKEKLDQIISSTGVEALIRGPMPAAISRIQRFHRMEIIIQAPDASAMGKILTAFRQGTPVKPAVVTAIDVDPMNLL